MLVVALVGDDIGESGKAAGGQIGIEGVKAGYIGQLLASSAPSCTLLK